MIQGFNILSMLYDTDVYIFNKKNMTFTQSTRDVYFVKLSQVFSSLYDHTHPKDSYNICPFSSHLRTFAQKFSSR